jgi:hypothetical protein
MSFPVLNQSDYMFSPPFGGFARSRKVTPFHCGDGGSFDTPTSPIKQQTTHQHCETTRKTHGNPNSKNKTTTHIENPPDSTPETKTHPNPTLEQPKAITADLKFDEKLQNARIQPPSTTKSLAKHPHNVETLLFSELISFPDHSSQCSLLMVFL